MIKIKDKRGTGKSSRLLLLAKENNGVVVSSNARYLKSLAKRYGLTDITIISYLDIANSFVGKGYPPCPVYIDDIDLFAKYMVQAIGDLQGYTESENEFI